MKKLDSAKSRAMISKIARLILGCVIYGVGFQFFMYHNAIPTGGVTGVAMIINYLTGLPVGIMGIVINIPLFAVAWKKLGWRFLAASLVGMALSSLMVDALALTPVNLTDDPLLGCVFGGLIKGFGLGLVYSTGATTGGVDIVAKLLRRKYQYINFGTIILILDVAIILAFAMTLGKYDSAMYGLMAMFISTKVIDFVLYGALTSKLCYIISDSSEKVKTDIVNKLHRGVTLLRGEGAYSGREKQVLLCVVKRQQVMELRKLVRESDEKAFLIFTDARDVYGKGFMSIYSSD